MLKEALAQTLVWTTGFVREPLSLAELRDATLAACRHLSAAGSPVHIVPATLRAEVHRVGMLASVQFPGEGLHLPTADDSLWRADDLELGQRWLAEAPAGPAAFRDPLPERWGFQLLALTEAGAPPASRIEDLLRHIETKRAGCLSGWRGVRKAGDRDCERLAVAILLFRTARRNEDLRPLNAGLKLFDWFGASSLDRPAGTDGRRVRVLLTALEGLQCVEELLNR